MNTKASVAYGWGVLILAGGGAYYFAKRSINSDRADRANKIEQERQALQRLRESEYTSKPAPATSSIKSRAKVDTPRDPSNAGSSDPAPVSHAQDDASTGDKFAASQPFRSRKGDRFS